MFKIKEYITNNYCYEVSKELVVEDYPTYFKVKGLELLEEGDYLGISNNYDIPIEVYNLLLDYPLGTTKIEEGLFVIVSIDKELGEEIREILLLDS